MTMPVRANVLEAACWARSRATTTCPPAPSAAPPQRLACLLLRLAGRLARAHTGLLAHAVNKRSVALLERHGYGRPTRRADVLYLSREVARIRAASEYEELLRTGDATRRLCTRAGATARGHRRYWDAAGEGQAACARGQDHVRPLRRKRGRTRASTPAALTNDPRMPTGLPPLPVA